MNKLVCMSVLPHTERDRETKRDTEKWRETEAQRVSKRQRDNAGSFLKLKS